ncbi:hypothetical protein [Marisediminicola antarctica]|uniref:hypothetical protein n=1 Tax=Marisediminicola antarctica TaxID=674079 RepID=UPI001379CC05|nr:hypothetical protein [Marisediminicola antarctica]
MTIAPPPLGLLLDVDGPIASPVTRTIAIETITNDLVTLANQGIPVVFNTGRSDVFIRDQVVKPMLAAGLAMDARVFGVCEKGAVWFGATMTNFAGVQVDRNLALPDEIVADLRALFDARYSDTMFWDDGKHAMVSLEQRTDVTSGEFLPQRDRFAADAFDLLERNGVGAELGDRSSAHPVSVRIEPTVISTDIERVSLGKALGAERALSLLADSGPIPRLWRTVGDSRSDYGMADHLHANGFDVAHVDVRPADGIPDKPYRVITQGDLDNDEAGAEFLAHWVREFAG